MCVNIRHKHIRRAFQTCTKSTANKLSRMGRRAHSALLAVVPHRAYSTSIPSSSDQLHPPRRGQRRAIRRAYRESKRPHSPTYIERSRTNTILRAARPITYAAPPRARFCVPNNLSSPRKKLRGPCRKLLRPSFQEVSVCVCVSLARIISTLANLPPPETLAHKKYTRAARAHHSRAAHPKADENSWNNSKTECSRAAMLVTSKTPRSCRLAVIYFQVPNDKIICGFLCVCVCMQPKYAPAIVHKI